MKSETVGSVAKPGDYRSCLVGLPIAVQVRKRVHGTSGLVAGVKAGGAGHGDEQDAVR